MNVFDQTLNQKNPIRVNNFDWSHANNFTTDLGRITPIFTELVPAHSSVRIDPTIGLQFMPMVFPIQTRMKLRVSFFKYPLRALWKDYRDYVGNFRAGLVEPYHDFDQQGHPTTGSLYDYLGLPTTFAGSYGGASFSVGDAYYGDHSSQYVGVDAFLESFKLHYTGIEEQLKNNFDPVYALDFTDYDLPYIRLISKINFTFPDDVTSVRVDLGNHYYSLSSLFVAFYDSNGNFMSHSVLSVESRYTSLSIPKGAANYLMGILINSVNAFLDFVAGGYSGGDSPIGFSNDIKFNTSGKDIVSDITNRTSPYYDSGITSENKDKQLKISAYAARAYEGIYNAYFRDDRNNPYYLNGEVQYNKWIPTDDGGADRTPYRLRYSNWEKDFLTTAVQSPQQGVAPLVGLTTYEDVTFNDDGTTTTKQRLALVDEDGRKFGLDFDSDADGLNDVRYTPLESGQLVQQPRSLINLAQSGISINDLRNVNAYQKYLELNMRAGYSYKDIIEQRFNVKVRYSDLLMPEFIGGFSEDIEMHSITQTVETSNDGSYAGSLGSQAGVAGCRRNGRPISVFCDEESIILGVCVVTPIPVYTQLLPKHFLYRELLDHYQPEFNNIGFQPITYKEVCPVQAFGDNPDTLNDTFGYQRPWYEYVQKYDVAHGLYRTQLRNFLMNRTFDVKPELSESFLIVDPDQVNDVFSVTETTDKIYGQIWFNCTAKLPISRVAIPRLD